MASVAFSPSLPTRPAVVEWPGLPVVGPLFELRRDQLGTFVKMGAAADAVRFTVFGKTLHLLTHPDHLKHVLVDNAKNYGKQTRGYQAMRSVVGDGLLTSEGDHWLRQRRIASPAFHKKRIDGFADTFARIADETANGWTAPQTLDERAERARSGAQGSPNGRPGAIDVSREMMRLTLRIATITLLSRDSIAEADEVGDALTTGLEHIIYRMNTPWAFPEKWPTPWNRKFHRAMARLDGVVNATIAERRANGGGTGDLLDMLMQPDDHGEVMTDAQLRDEVMTIMLAGHETTAMSLTWTLWLLSQHPEVERALRAEIDEVLGGRIATIADLPRLALAERVIAESMRLYPPAWVIARSAIGDDDVCGEPVAAGDWVMLSPWVTHRHPAFWPDAERFDPDRFLPERVAARHRHAWIPFSTGQRKCIGDQFALMEARLVLVTLMQRARFTAQPGQTVEPEPLVTLRPKGGLPLTVTPLERKAPRPATPADPDTIARAKAAGCPYHH